MGRSCPTVHDARLLVLVGWQQRSPRPRDRRRRVRRVENRSELDGWDSVAFGMALDMDRGRWVLRLSGDADASVATAIDKALRDAVLHADDGRDLDVELADLTYLDGH